MERKLSEINLKININRLNVIIVRLLVLLVVLLMPLMKAFPQENSSSAFEKFEHVTAEGTLPYRLLKPESIEPGKKYPLVIFMHGAGERGTDNEINLRYISEPFLDEDNRKKFPAFLLVPQCPPGGWWSSHQNIKAQVVMQEQPSLTMALLISLLPEIEQTYPIDLSRVYVSGLSMGGFGTWELIARFPDRFAAAVPICGGGDTTTAARIAHMPIWAFHGALDQVVLPRQSRNMIQALIQAGGTPGYTEYPEVGHDSWNYAFRDPYLLPWLFRQHLKKN